MGTRGSIFKISGNEEWVGDINETRMAKAW